MMQVRVAGLDRDASDRMQVMETLVVDGAEYNFGTIYTLCDRLEHSSPEDTTRITMDTAVRRMLLSREVATPTDAYPASHRWCRFYRGAGFDAFLEELHQAEDELQKREPLKNADANKMTGWLSGGEVWAISNPAPDTFGDGRHKVLGVQSDEELEQFYITFDGGGEDGYVILLDREGAKEASDALVKLTQAALANAGQVEYEVASDMETIRFDWDPERGTIGLSGEGWSVEDDGGVEMTASEAEELSWALLEQSLNPTVNLGGPDILGEDE